MSTVYRTNPDGTQVPTSDAAEEKLTFSPPMTPLAPHQHIDDLTAMQLGLYYILTGLKFHSLDRAELIRSGRSETRVFEFKAVMFDFADAEDSLGEQSVSAVIQEATDTDTAFPGPLSNAAIEEDTLDQFGPGTVIRRLFENTVELHVIVLCTNKDDRAAVRKGLISAFAKEPTAELSGRQVTIQEYFGQVARYDLIGVRYEDSADTASRKLYPLVARITSDIVAVDLIEAPSEFRPSVSLDQL